MLWSRGVVLARVARHRDYWDLLGSVMESVPLAGAVYRSAVALMG